MFMRKIKILLFYMDKNIKPSEPIPIPKCPDKIIPAFWCYGTCSICKKKPCLKL